MSFIRNLALRAGSQARLAVVDPALASRRQSLWLQQEPLAATVASRRLTATDSFTRHIELLAARPARALAGRQGPPGDCYDLERDKDGRHGRIMRYNLNEGRH